MSRKIKVAGHNLLRDYTRSKLLCQQLECQEFLMSLHIPQLTDAQIEHGKETASLQLQGHFEHNDCIRMAYQWLDAQTKTKTKRDTYYAVKHIIETWSGRYVSQSDVEVAAFLHPDIFGSYPNFNVSARLTKPSLERLANIGEAGKHNPVGRARNPDPYSKTE